MIDRRTLKSTVRVFLRPRLVTVVVTIVTINLLSSSVARLFNRGTKCLTE
jgi:hypothetical protein